MSHPAGDLPPIRPPIRRMLLPQPSRPESLCRSAMDNPVPRWSLWRDKSMSWTESSWRQKTEIWRAARKLWSGCAGNRAFVFSTGREFGRRAPIGETTKPRVRLPKFSLTFLRGQRGWAGRGSGMFKRKPKLKRMMIRWFVENLVRQPGLIKPGLITCCLLARRREPIVSGQRAIAYLSPYG